MSTRRRQRLGVAVLTGALVMAGCETQPVDDEPSMRVGTTIDQPLFSVPTADGMVGFDADIAREVVERLGSDPDRIEFTETVFAERERALEEGEVDIVVATYTITDRRDERVDFAGPYLVAGQDILVPSGNPLDIQGVDDLNTPEVVTCTSGGTTSIDRLLELAPEAEPSVVLFPTMSECFDALARGDVDTVTSDDLILLALAAYPRRMVHREGLGTAEQDFELVGNPFSEEPYGIGVPLGSELRCEINDVLQDIIDDGTWERIFERTIGEIHPVTPEPPEIDNEGC